MFYLQVHIFITLECDIQSYIFGLVIIIKYIPLKLAEFIKYFSCENKQS